jgi:hypothetical protein
MITAKEKALELYDKFEDVYPYGPIAIQCALTCVDEILKSHYKVLIGVMPKTVDYWQEVKQEINKL